MDHMISNGIKQLADMAQVEQFQKAYENHDKIVYLNVSNGTKSEIDKDLPTTNHTMHDIDSLILLLAYIDPLRESSQSIFVAADSINCIMDYSGFRVNRAKIPLNHSPILRYLREGLVAEPKEFIRSLKYNLSSAESIEPDPIPALQTLKFESSSSAEHSNHQNDEGVSKALKSKVTGAAAIPANFTVHFEMYPAIAEELDDFGRVHVHVELHVDPSRGYVSFRPLPGSIDKAIATGNRAVKNAVCKKLIAADLEPITELVFLGSP